MQGQASPKPVRKLDLDRTVEVYLQVGWWLAVGNAARPPAEHAHRYTP